MDPRNRTNGTTLKLRSIHGKDRHLRRPARNRGPITHKKAVIPADLPDAEIRRDHIPEPDPYYVDLGMLYRLAALEQVRGRRFEGIPLHLACEATWGQGKGHDLEQFAALLGFPYYRIPLTGEVRDITLIGSVKVHGDGKGGTDSR